MEDDNQKIYSIYIILTRTHSMLSQLICYFKKASFSHSAISFDKDFSTMYGFGRKYSYCSFYGVFRQESFDEGFLGQHKQLPGAALELRVTRAQYDRVIAMINDFTAHRDQYKYNILGLYNALQGKSVVYKNKFFCSEFVYYVLHECGILDFGKARGLVTPQDFYDHIEAVFEGDFKKGRRPFSVLAAQ